MLGNLEFGFAQQVARLVDVLQQVQGTASAKGVEGPGCSWPVVILQALMNAQLNVSADLFSVVRPQL